MPDPMLTLSAADVARYEALPAGGTMLVNTDQPLPDGLPQREKCRKCGAVSNEAGDVLEAGIWCEDMDDRCVTEPVGPFPFTVTLSHLWVDDRPEQVVEPITYRAYHGSAQVDDWHHARQCRHTPSIIHDHRDADPDSWHVLLTRPTDDDE